jgi:hypothetical protein
MTAKRRPIGAASARCSGRSVAGRRHPSDAPILGDNSIMIMVMIMVITIMSHGDESFHVGRLGQGHGNTRALTVFILYISEATRTCLGACAMPQ